ncbi:MAG: hypothetical protein KKD39_01180, partial [Candidatus Altiarchaeota archaeon]|nr:hypothetical protein [Candidatus Altiarchaeota archaeon]
MAEKKEENRRGAEIVKEILKMVREKGPLTETQLAKEIALDRKQTSKYTTYLSTKGLVKVEKKLFGEPIISPASKDILVKTASKDNDTKPQKRKEGVKKVSAEDEKDVKDIYESLMEDFRGVMRLHSESDGDYIAALLLDSGNIMSATFEKEGSEKEEIGDHALKSIIETFSGTSGELEIYEMEEDKFNETMRENISYTLTKSFPLTNLKLKIKLMAKKQEKEDSKGLTSFVSRIKLKNATEKERKRMGFLHGRLDESVKLLDFARKAREKPGREESEEE